MLESLVKRGDGAGIVSEYSIKGDPQLRMLPIDCEESVYRHAVAYRSDRATKALLKLLSAIEPEQRRRNR